MRTVSFILAVALILAGPSMAGSPDANSGSLGVGTFSYNGSPIVAPLAVMAAVQ